MYGNSTPALSLNALDHSPFSNLDRRSTPDKSDSCVESICPAFFFRRHQAGAVEGHCRAPTPGRLRPSLGHHRFHALPGRSTSMSARLPGCLGLTRRSEPALAKSQAPLLRDADSWLGKRSLGITAKTSNSATYTEPEILSLLAMNSAKV